jgi:hypothetical protein
MCVLVVVRVGRGGRRRHQLSPIIESFVHQPINPATPPIHACAGPPGRSDTGPRDEAGAAPLHATECVDWVHALLPQCCIIELHLNDHIIYVSFSLYSICFSLCFSLWFSLCFSLCFSL